MPQDIYLREPLSNHDNWPAQGLRNHKRGIADNDLKRTSFMCWVLMKTSVFLVRVLGGCPKHKNVSGGKEMEFMTFFGTIAGHDIHRNLPFAKGVPETSVP